MILKYVLKNFSRRKIRTILMVLALMVSTGLIVAMSATVETIRRSNVDVLSTAIGRYDLAISKTETSPEPFVNIPVLSERMLQADERLTAVYPRIVTPIEMNTRGLQGSGTLIAIDPNENIGLIEVVDGELDLSQKQIALLEDSSFALDLSVGDTLDLAYSFPQPREKGQLATVGSSQRRVVERFTINAIVRQSGVVDASVNAGLLMNIADAQAWLGLPDQAQLLVGLVDPELYEAPNAEDAALAVRDVAVSVQTALGDEYLYTLSKANILDQSAQGFLVLQALINTYGVMAFAVVGLLIHTLVMTNVQDQQREMAILRILGSQRNLLFAIVMAEVTVIGVLGVGFGVVLGQIITRYAVLPFITWQLSQTGLTATIQPVVTISTMIPPVLSAFVVLYLSALRPAQNAAKTKVMHAINPGVADNIQLEDLESLRQQRPNGRLFFFGLIMMVIVAMVMGLNVVSTLGNPALEATIIFAAILLMVFGVGLVFLIFTRPLEKLILFLLSFPFPRHTYFASKNVGRSNKRNTLISLLVLFSGVLPSFLATQNAISFANIETDVKLNIGAPIQLNVFSRFEDPTLAEADWLSPSFVSEEMVRIEGIETAVGLTRNYTAQVADSVGMRSGNVQVRGVTGDLNEVLYDEYIVFTAGGREALAQIVQDDNAVVISEGLANQLAVRLGDEIKLGGEGLDHQELFTIVGIAQRLPGFRNVGSIRSQAYGSNVFISLRAFHRLTTPVDLVPPSMDSRVLTNILASTDPAVDAFDIQRTIWDTFGSDNNFWTRIVDTRLENAVQEQRQSQLFLLVLTLISFTTAVFGVFAVIYVTIYARRMEIGMMKAVGTRNRDLTAMLSLEAIAMTLSAALAGIIAGSTMGYALAYIENVGAQRPMQFALDGTVTPFVVIMVTVASILGTIFSARRILKRKAVEILRMS